MELKKRISCGMVAGLLAFLNLWPFSTAAARSDFHLNFHNCTVAFLPDRDSLPALLESIEKANKEILMSFFFFKTRDDSSSGPDKVLVNLEAAVKRGVRVTALLEQNKEEGDRTTQENRRTVKRLKKLGVDVSLDSPTVTTHTKMAVFDGKRTLIGSHNLTQSALLYNHETSVLIDSPQMAAEAASYIRELIANLRKVK